jgi:glycerophosphoryl diester phosphodiesterase
MVLFIAASLLYYVLFHLVSPSSLGREILSTYGIEHPTVIAHRGSSASVPESTEAAYRRAIEAGAHYLEADIRRTSDDHLIVFHDTTLRRTSNIREVFPDRSTDQVHSFTLQELREMDYGSWFYKRNPNKIDQRPGKSSILTLEELLQITDEYEQPVGLVLDVKGVGLYTGIEAQIVEQLESYYASGPPVPTMIFSSSLDMLKRFRKLDADLLLLLLIDDINLTYRRMNSWLDLAEDVVHGVGIKGFNAWPWRVSQAHKRGLFVYPYVINNHLLIQALVSWNSDGYVTDKPEMFTGMFTELSSLLETEL